MAEGRAAPLALFPSPTCHLVCPAPPEPLCRGPRPRRGPLAALKNRAGRRWCWAGHDVRGRGQRERGRAQSLCAQPGSCPLGFWPAWCFSSSQCGRGEILSSWGKEKPLCQRVEETWNHPDGDPVHSSAPWTSFSPPASFIRTQEEDGWRREAGQACRWCFYWLQKFGQFLKGRWGISVPGGAGTAVSGRGLTAVRMQGYVRF